LNKMLSWGVVLLSALSMGGLAACRTPEPTPSPTRTPRPTFTSVPVVTPTFTPLPAPTDAPTATAPPRPTSAPAAPRATATPHPPTPTRAPAAPPQPPLNGGTWDFEGGWYNTPSGFEGRVDRVAEGWKFFRRRGQYGQPTFNENKNPVNVHRGIRSQEIAFESSDGEAGVYRSLSVIPNHRYTISAWGIHYPSPTPIELFLGVDTTGGGDWQAVSVQWFPWNETGEATWLHTQATIRVTGTTMTIFLKAVHRVAAGGGATLFDDVSVTDLGE
jgi:hypothetical protein